VKKLTRIAVVLVFCATGLIAQNTDSLKPYSECSSGNKFQIAQTDRLPQAMMRTVDTKNGEKSIETLDGYRVLITYDETEPFVNLKVEQFAKDRYKEDKQTLIESLEYLAAQPGMEYTKPAYSNIGNFDVYGSNRARLEGGVLSIYTLFDDADQRIATVYLLNADPQERKFKGVAEYKLLRDEFIKAYGACMQAALKH
jgi:hypothetical protein